MRCLVTGAGGFLGRRVVAALAAAGNDVRALVRPSSDPARLPEHEHLETFRADLRGGTELAPAFDGVDALVHLATQMVGDDFTVLAGTLVGTERILAAFGESEARRLVLCSSFSVYDWSLSPRRHTEHAPLLADPFAGGAYAAAKTWQERLARRTCEQHAKELVVLRPGFVWGPGNTDLACVGQRFGRRQLVFGPRRRLALTHVENCADAFVPAVAASAAAGQVFDVVDDGGTTAMEYARAFRDGERPDLALVPVPYWLVRLGVGAVGLASTLLFGPEGKLPSMFVPVRFALRFRPVLASGAKLRERLKWTPRLADTEALRSTWSAPAGSAR